jgi:hypothetical protein
MPERATDRRRREQAARRLHRRCRSAAPTRCIQVNAKLEKLATARTKTDIKVTISPPHKEGEHLNAGGGFVLEIKDARIKHYAVEDGVETWQVADFESVKRTRITHTIGAS